MIRRSNNQLNTKMSTTIQMPQLVEETLRAMILDGVTKSVNSLAEKYNFDAEEGLRHLKMDEMKLVPKVSSRSTSPVTKEKKNKKEKKTKDENVKPKRGPTGYLLFAADARPALKLLLEEELASGEKLSPQAVIKAIAAKWKALEEHERDDWNKRAAEAKSAQNTTDDE